jgi:hypothetical protein
MNEPDEQKALLAALRQTYTDDGYSFFLEPPRSVLPDFLGTYRPDAVALKEGHNVAIEVKQESAREPDQMKNRSALFMGRPDWTFKVFYYKKSSPPRLDISSLERIEEALLGAKLLRDASRLTPAVVLGWATLEAVTRALLPNRTPSAQTPARIVEVLASEGMVMPKEADFLRHLVPIRNRYVHGDLNERATIADVDNLLAIIGRFVIELKSSPGPVDQQGTAV